MTTPASFDFLSSFKWYDCTCIFHQELFKKNSLDFYVSAAERLDLFNTVLRILGRGHSWFFAASP